MEGVTPNINMTYYNDYLHSLQKEYSELVIFLKRVPYNGPLSCKGGIESLRLFMEMLKEMNIQEKYDHFEKWIGLFSHVLNLFVEDTSTTMHHLLHRVLGKLLRIIREVFFREWERSRAVDLLLSESARVLNVKMDYVLRLCVGESIITELNWRFRKDRLLTESLRSNDKLLCVTLIKYGYQYKYDKVYFKECCCNLANLSMEVNGRSIVGNFVPQVSQKGHLRWQLAAELLLTLFSQVELHYEAILRHLWRSVPFPFITGEEMYFYFHRYYHRQQSGDITLEEICDAYVKRNSIFPVPAQKQPRSLLVLSKIKVRKNLLEANGVIYDKDIDSLHIPTYLKLYLQLKVD